MDEFKAIMLTSYFMEELGRAAEKHHEEILHITHQTRSIAGKKYEST